MDLIDRFTDRRAQKDGYVAAVVPHGGYLSSGSVAGSVYSRLSWPSVAVVLGPNHTGAGKRFSIMRRGQWVTPLGEMTVHEELAKAIRSAVPEIEEDAVAQKDEHSIEIQLPFLQRIGSLRQFVPILMAGGDASDLQELGTALARAIQGVAEKVILVLSANLTRYEPQAVARQKDARAIDRIVALDEMGLVSAVEQESISMCGSYSTAVGLVAAKCLGATEAVLTQYHTSGDAAGQGLPVCGYAGILVR